MLWVPPSARDFGAIDGNVIGTRPVGAFGTSVIPGASNTKAATWTTLVASTAFDSFFMVINFNSNSSSAAIRNTLCDIGLGAALSERVLIPDLLFAGADSYVVTGGVWYVFPLFVPSGSRISARAQVNNATPGTFRCAIWLYGRPRDMRMIRFGEIVDASGITASSSSGTAVTPGTTGEGAWTSLGSATGTYWWWQFGFGCGDTTMSAVAYHADFAVGDASNKDIVIDDSLIITSAAEAVSVWPQHARPQRSPDGTTGFGRLQCSGTADATITMSAYALR